MESPLIGPIGVSLVGSIACGGTGASDDAPAMGAFADAACSTVARSSSHWVGERRASRLTVLTLTETPASSSASRIVSNVWSSARRLRISRVYRRAFRLAWPGGFLGMSRMSLACAFKSCNQFGLRELYKAR